MVNVSQVNAWNSLSILYSHAKRAHNFNTCILKIDYYKLNEWDINAGLKWYMNKAWQEIST